MQKIDVHLHVELEGLDADRVIDYMDDHHIEKCWLLTWEEINPPIDTIYQNLSPDEVFEAYKEYPDRIVPFYAPDPKTRNLSQKIKHHKEKGLKGCGELKVTHKWEDKVIGEYLRVINAYDLPLLFHMEEPRMHYVPANSGKMEKLLDDLLNGALNGITKYYLTKFFKNTSVFKGHIENRITRFPGYLYDFSNLEKRLREFPDLDFIGHGPHFWNNISDDPSEVFIHDKGPIDSFGIIDRLLSEYDNFYCDVSGKSGFNALNRDRDKAKLFLEKHYGKILFGTDNTGLDYEGLIRSFQLPEDKMKKIFYENADGLIND